jgi:hypothetical protein
MKYCLCLLLILFCALSTAAPLTGPPVGTTAPDIKVRNLVTWEDVTLGSQRGKVVANHLGYGDRSLNEPLADINHALAEPSPEEQ